MDFMQLMYGLSFGAKNRGEVVGRTEVGEYTVDTCHTRDCGYETGICKDCEWIIVEYYDNKEDAFIGHERWCNFAKSNPQEAYSVQLESMEQF